MPKNNRAGAPALSVSQNFLTSGATVRRLLKLTSISQDDHVLEIGAGRGHITRELVKRAGAVTAYEADTRLCSFLSEKYGGASNLSVIYGDFLKAQLPARDPYKIFSNIPFSITSQIVRKITCAHNPPQEAWLVMEKGAAKRFCGKPYDTKASVLIKPFFDISVKYHFRREDFHPAPSVDCVLLHFERREQPDISPAHRKSFSDFVERGMRYGVDLTKKQVSTALRLADLPPARQSETMLYVQWLCLFRCYRRFHGG